ncbi:DUF3073 domain-containing protein [Aquiluna borgnonia]|uniref:DUF3073 domain-containing protein n=1 Tax=Aquiluna borgnonia TaxID=2499157 RepID=A0A7D4TJN2_9MICO|nr:DUF3073 domain-containing protein [Aquiluna borgnonia]QKJ25811.1 DUF3073 domain-containing protein [Aquiluna borgnonia]
MGRGRQKAKNTKVARELKYYSPATDYSALEAELSTKSGDDQYEDKWADLYEDDEEEPAAPDDDRVVELDDEK